MTDIIKRLREDGDMLNRGVGHDEIGNECLEAADEIVRLMEQIEWLGKNFELALAAEREACAKIAYEMWRGEESEGSGEDIATAIREQDK